MVGGPETRYAVAPDGVHVAYQVVGDGPIDLVFLFEWMSNVDVQWQEPSVASFLDRLSSFSRLIMLNPRGTGFSDPVDVGRVPTVEEWMEDIEVVMDTAGSERAGIVRMGVHTGECEVVDGKLSGIAVNTGARIAALAGPREILVSRTVVDVVSGSGATFEDRGTRHVKGVLGAGQLFAVR